jgi:hypothetical protein
MNVRFFAGTKREYLSLTKHNPQALYFCEDTNELYWGDRCLSDGVRVVETKNDMPTLASAADGIVYYIKQTRNGYTLSPDRTGWLQTIYAPATDAYEVPESEIYNTVTTVGAVRDVEKRLTDKIDDIEKPDLSAYAKKTDLPTGYLTAIPDEYITEAELTVELAKVKQPTIDLAGYATETFVHEMIAKAELQDKEADLEAYYTKDQVNNLIPDVSKFGLASELALKANNILFTTTKFVTKPIGNFVKDEDISSLTIAELFAKLLGLSDIKSEENPDEPGTPDAPKTPEEIVDELTNEKATMYSQDAQGNLVETPFMSNSWTTTEASVKMDGVSTVYTITDGTGMVVEAGYQEATDYTEEDWLTVALPSKINSVKVKMYDPDVEDWVEMNWKVVKAAEQTMPGYTIWTVPEEYEILSGDTYRFVILD